LSKEELLKAAEVKASLDIMADKVLAYGCIKSYACDNVSQLKSDNKGQKEKRRIACNRTGKS